MATELVQPQKWYEVFKAGERTDNLGRTRYWSEEDLKEIASRTNASSHDVPLVIGHPQTNSPAWGWSKKNFKVKDNTLLAQFRDVTPSFAEMVNNKQFPKVSMSVRSDGTLKHIGFLGGTPPAVPGMKEIAFQEEENETIYESEFNEYGGSDMPVNAKVETDPKDKEIQDLKNTISEFMEAQKVKDLEIASLKTQTLTSEFAEKARQKDEEIVSLKAQLEKIEGEKRQADYSNFCESLKDCITPSDKPFVMGLFEICHSTGNYEFSEGKEENSVEKFKDFLKRNLKKQVEFSEIATKEKASDRKDSSSEFSEFDNVDVSERELDGKIKACMKQDKLSYSEAYKKVRS